MVPSLSAALAVIPTFAGAVKLALLAGAVRLTVGTRLPPLVPVVRTTNALKISPVLTPGRGTASGLPVNTPVSTGAPK